MSVLHVITYFLCNYVEKGVLVRSPHSVLVQVMAAQKDFNKLEFNFLLRGGIVMDRGNMPANPAPEWITPVMPSPTTHAILTVLKAGETVFQTLSLTETVFHALTGA